MSSPSHALVVDAVLLPPDPIRDVAVRLNRRLNARHPVDNIRLGRAVNLPHISVAMVGVRQEHLHELDLALKEAAERFLPMHLSPGGIDLYRKESGGVITSLLIRKTPVLQGFHETILAAFAPYILLPVTPDMVATVSGEPTSSHTLAYMNSFLDISAFERYAPHITLGMGELPTDDAEICLPDRFGVHTAGLCQVGNHGVCRKLLSLHKPGSRI